MTASVNAVVFRLLSGEVTIGAPQQRTLVMPLSDILNTDPLALGALAGLAVTVLVMILLFGFLLAKLRQANPGEK